MDLLLIEMDGNVLPTKVKKDQTLKSYVNIIIQAILSHEGRATVRWRVSLYFLSLPCNQTDEITNPPALSSLHR